MKIIQLLDSREIGGIETHVQTLSYNLIKNNELSSVVFFKDYGLHPLEKKLQDNEIPYHKLKRGMFSLVHFLKKESVDILHTHGYKAGIIGKIIGFFLKIKVISTYHSGDRGKGKVRVYTFLDNLLSPLCMPLAVSSEIGKYLSNKPQIIKNFVNISQKIISKGGCSSVGFVGRLSHEKGPDLYIKIANLFPDITFHIFGDGVMRNELREMASVNCVFHGHIDDIGEAWREIDLLCMPSRFEGLPMASLEAMGNGIPVLSSNVGALPELIEDYENGFVVEVGNIAQFQKKINEWIELSQDSRIKMSNKAHKTIKRHFNAEHEVRNMISVYRFLYGGGKL